MQQGALLEASRQQTERLQGRPPFSGFPILRWPICFERALRLSQTPCSLACAVLLPVLARRKQKPLVQQLKGNCFQLRCSELVPVWLPLLLPCRAVFPGLRFNIVSSGAGRSSVFSAGRCQRSLPAMAALGLGRESKPPNFSAGACSRGSAHVWDFHRAVAALSSIVKLHLKSLLDHLRLGDQVPVKETMQRTEACLGSLRNCPVDSVTGRDTPRVTQLLSYEQLTAPVLRTSRECP